MNYRTVAALVTMTVALAACGGGGFTQEDLDAAVDEAVKAALASTSTTTTTAEATTTTTRPAQTTTTESTLEASDFFAEIDVLESSCFGSAGANVTFEVNLGWPGEAFGTLTFEIRGLDDGAVEIATTEIIGTQYRPSEHVVGIPTCDPESITVVPTKFRPRG